MRDWRVLVRPARYPAASMRVLLLVNPRSGSGRSWETAREIARALDQRGHRSELLSVSEDVSEHEIREFMAVVAQDPARGACIIVGGDGTVHHAAQSAAATGLPLYHVAMGNENLFAREFAMEPRLAAVIGSIEQHQTRAVDLGMARLMTESSGSGEATGIRTLPILIMLSIGPDAGVVHRLDASPRLVPGHAAYTLPVIRELLKPSLPRLRVQVDGQTVVENVRGMLVVANSRHYALGFNPARDAVVDDGQLDVAFSPCESSVSWAKSLIAGHPTLSGGERPMRWRGREIIVESMAGPTPVQIDGEGAGVAHRVEITVRPGALRVLRPGVFHETVETPGTASSSMFDEE